jgi:hypothetical protein
MAIFEHEVDDPEMKATLNALAKVLAEALPEGWGFTLMLFSYGEGGNLFYISSAERSDVLNMLREFLQKANVN